jgi:hypothetical protein
MGPHSVKAPAERPERAWRARAAPALVIAGALVVHVAALRAEGRRWWCACGRPTPWVSDAWGPHNSQHLFDPYSFTHVLHGLLLCGLLAWAFPRLGWRWRLCLAVCAEVAWEMFENSQFVIDRYRAAAALGYEGDTVANSLGDVLSCAAGFLLARRLGVRGSVALFLATEAVLLLWVRDSLLLNVVMLIHPIDAIKAWQAVH